MASQEYRRVANQPHLTKSRQEWEALRRALLMVVAEFKASDAEGCYTVDVRVVPRDRTKTLASSPDGPAPFGGRA
jgi:hypothetical protein